MIRTPEWKEIISDIRIMADKWLTITSPGPMNAILRLKSALEDPDRNPPHSFNLKPFTPPALQPPTWSQLEETRRREYVDPTHRGYEVMYTITDQYATDPIVEEGYPARFGTNPSLRGANGLAKRALEEWGTAWMCDEVVRGMGVLWLELFILMMTLRGLLGLRGCR